MRRWNTLLEVDADVAVAAAKVAAISPAAVDLLAEKYLALNDKTYLDSIVEKVIEHTKANPIEGKLGDTYFRRTEQGSYIITRGKKVGRTFPTYEALRAEVATA